MSSLTSILRAVSEGESSVELITGDGDRSVLDIRLIENLQHLDGAGPGTLAVLDRHVSKLATTYQFDIAVRRAISLGLCGLGLLLAPGSNISITGLALARKGDLAVARIDPAIDPSKVIVEMARQTADDLHLEFQRARRTSEALRRARLGPTDLVELAALASTTLARRVEVTTDRQLHPGRFLSVPALVTEPDGQLLTVERTGNTDKDAFLELVLWRIAAEASRSIVEEHRRERARRMTIAEVLLRLMDADRATRAGLSATAKRLGVDPTGWHAIVRFELENLIDLTVDEIAAYALRDTMADVTLEAARAFGSSAFVTQDASMIALLWSDPDPPSPDDGLSLHRRSSAVLERLVRACPGLRIYCGVGSRRAGFQGLAVSATEARMAISDARATDRMNVPASYDASGLRPALVEWYSSPSVRESVDAMLAPLDQLPPNRRDPLLRTLTTFLDTNGSVTATAKTLHLHRNAVRYRIKRALEILDVDAEEPDQRIFLHLACRARMEG